MLTGVIFQVMFGRRIGITIIDLGQLRGQFLFPRHACRGKRETAVLTNDIVKVSICLEC